MAEELTEPQAGGTSWAEFTKSLAAEAPQAPVAPVAEPAPRLADQLAHPEQLTGSFTYEPSSEANMQLNPSQPERTVTMSEADGLRQLHEFLDNFARTAQAGGDESEQELGRQATDMLDNMTYIGTPELAHGTAAMAAGWKEYLDSNPQASLYLWAAQQKSGQFVLDQALGHFNDEDLQRYHGRLHLASEIGPDLPEQHKVVMVDDWITTGRQIQNAYRTELKYRGGSDGPVHAEVQLLVASGRQIQDGLVDDDGIDRVQLPIRAVYQANETQSGRPIITGIHSSTDDEFEIPIAGMVDSLRTKHGQPDAAMPPLSNIVRPYRQPDYDPANVDRLKSAAGQ